jgi:hypothetical protein
MPRTSRRETWALLEERVRSGAHASADALIHAAVRTFNQATDSDLRRGT